MYFSVTVFILAIQKMGRSQVYVHFLVNEYKCAMVKSRYIGDGHPTFNDGILTMGPYKPLRTWVEFPIPYYMEIMGVDRPWHK